MLPDRRLERRTSVTWLVPILRIVIGIIGIIATSLAALPVARLGAQDTSPAGTPTDLPPLLAAWAAAWEPGEADRLVELYTEDAVYEELPTASVARGPAEIRAFFGATHTSFAYIRMTPFRGFREGNRALLEGLFGGRAGEHRFEVPFVAVFDLYSVMDQIGALPTLDDAGTPALPPAG